MTLAKQLRWSLKRRAAWEDMRRRYGVDVPKRYQPIPWALLYRRCCDITRDVIRRNLYADIYSESPEWKKLLERHPP